MNGLEEEEEEECGKEGEREREREEANHKTLLFFNGGSESSQFGRGGGEGLFGVPSEAEAAAAAAAAAVPILQLLLERRDTFPGPPLQVNNSFSVRKEKKLF